MITYSIIKKSQLEGAHRLDAEYYQPEYLRVEEKLQSSPFLVLGECAFVTDGEHGSVELLEDGVKYLVAENIKEGFIDLEGVRFVSREVDRRNKRASLKRGDVILSIKGTVGLATVVYPEILPANLNRDVSRIVIESNQLNPFFLAVFLNTRFGRGQTLRGSSGNVQQMITLGRIRELLVPKVSLDFQRKIQELYNVAYRYLTNSESLYSQAENLLLEELGLKDFEPQDELSYVVNLSDSKSAYRLDAEYFQPKYQQIISFLKKKVSLKRLGELASFTKGVEPGGNAYQEEGKPFIRVSNLSKFGINDSDQKYLSEELYQALKSSYQSQLGEILLTKDATPGIAYVLKEPVEGIIAGGILRLKLKSKIEPEYLALVIGSMVGSSQVERDTAGSVILHWRPDQIKNLLVPILSQVTQQKIADLVRKSHKARRKARQLLEEAKHKVEQAIEQAGKNS